MRHGFLLFAVPVACVFACGDATQPAPPPPPLLTTPTFASADIPEDSIAYTECVIGDTTWVNYLADPHFVANPMLDSAPLPYVTFNDDTEPPNQCGDLWFNDRTRSFDAYYATDPDKPQENPYKYWWRRSRRADDGDGVLDSLPRIYRLPGVFKTDNVPVWLSQEYDAVGVILVLNQSPSLQISDEPFINPYFTAYGDINLAVQHWAHKPEPIQLAATRSGSNVTLTWSNAHDERSIDSTNIYRDGDFQRTVGPAVTSWVDSALPPATYRYGVKHIAAPSVVTHTIVAPPPNSAKSNDAWVTIPQPDPLAMYVAGEDLITQSGTYTWTAVTSGGTPPYTGHRWEYQPFGSSTWTQVGTQSSYQRYVQVTDPWFWLRAAVWDDNPTDSVVNRRIAVETWDGGGGGAAPTADATRVGVRLSDGTCSPRPPVGDPGRQAWLQMIMTSVERIAYCHVEPRTP